MRKELAYSFIVLCLLASTLLAGCGFKDIDKRYFVVEMGIDKTNNEEKPYRVTLKLGVPSIQIDVGKSKTQVETIETASIAEGVRLLKSHVDKEIDFGHCKVILFGESFARDNIREAVEWMSRRRDIQNIAAIAVGSPNAEDVIKVQPEIERFPGNSLNLFFSEDATESSYTFIESLSDLTRRLNEKGLDPFLPVVTMQQEDKTYVINQVALLDKEKVVTILNPDETQLLRQLAEHISLPKQLGSYRSDPYVALINSMKTKYKINKTDSAIKVDMNIKQAITFEEIPLNSYFEHPIQSVEQLEQAYSEDAKKLLQKIQATGVDPFGFGLRYRVKYHLPNFDQEWPMLYKSMEFDVKTKIEVRGTGLTR